MTSLAENLTKDFKNGKLPSKQQQMILTFPS